jgi:hypothetical protein
VETLNSLFSLEKSGNLVVSDWRQHLKSSEHGGTADFNSQTSRVK